MSGPGVRLVPMMRDNQLPRSKNIRSKLRLLVGQRDGHRRRVGTATFQFHQNSNHKKLIIGSTYNFQWADTAFAHGSLKGSVTPAGFSFKGNAGANCQVNGNGGRQLDPR